MIINPFKKTHLLASLTLAMGISSSAIAEDKIPVVASFSILGDLVSQVGGEHVDITTLVKANGDTHVYSPSPKDAQSIKKAKLLVVNGLNFEGWMPRLLESTHFSGTQVVASDGIDVISKDSDKHDEHAAHNDEHEEHHDEHAAHDDEHEEHHDEHAAHNDEHEEHHDEHAAHDDEHEEHHDEHAANNDEHEAHHDEHEEEGHAHNHGGIDPHAWNSIVNVKIYVQNIAKGLSKVDPEHSTDYQKNATAYLAKLEQLEAKLHAQIDSIPVNQRKVTMPHNAFAYFSRDFHVEFIAVQGTSTEAEASAAGMAKVIKQIRREKINAVFMENIADNRMVEQISRETDAKIGGKLFTGALSEPQGPAPTYLDMVEYNVTTIVDALTH